MTLIFIGGMFAGGLFILLYLSLVVLDYKNTVENYQTCIQHYDYIRRAYSQVIIDNHLNPPVAADGL